MYSQYRWAWSKDPLKSQTEIKKIMTLVEFQLLLKQFRVMKSSTLPRKDDSSFHPLQNINAGVDYLRKKPLSKWSMGWKLCVDEEKVRSISKRNPYKVRNPEKPIRMGWTISKISDKGLHGGYYVSNHVAKVGKKIYKHPENGKNYDIVDQLLSGLKNGGRLVVMDSRFPTVKLMLDVKLLWDTKLISTQRGRTRHISSNHKENL